MGKWSTTAGATTADSSRRTMARVVVAGAVLTALGGFLAVFPATADPAECVAAEKASPDFDGSSGDRPDIPVGAPGEALTNQGGAAVKQAGAVEIRFAGSGVKPQHLTLPTPKAGDKFGSALLADDFDQDSCTDLLVGAPGREVGGVTDAGAVFAYKGTPEGLKPWKTLTMGADGMPGQPQAGAGFGSVLDSYDVGGMLMAGVPRYDVDGIKDAGAVIEFDLTNGGSLSTQNTPGSGAHAEAGDYYGAQVQGRYWEGDDRAFFASAPGEDVGSVKDAGGVFDCAESTTAEPSCTPITQNTKGVPGSVEAGDRFGQALSYDNALLIGAPGEDIGATADGGAVVVWFDRGDQGPAPLAVTQNHPGWAGVVEVDDEFGATLTQGTAGPDSYTVQIGVPGEHIDMTENAGAVSSGRLRIPESGAPTVTSLGGMSGDNTASETDAGDRFGAALESYEFINGDGVAESFWVIGAPGDHSGAGEVVVAETGPAGDKPPKSQLWRQTADTPESGDAFGTALRANH